MFTGIVEAVGLLVEARPRGGGAVRLLVEAPEIVEGTRVGDSVAVDGCCLTVAAVEGARLAFDAVPETLARTALADRHPPARVNLERALRADGRLGGHFVLGHVDGTGRVAALERRGDDVRLAVEAPAELLPFVAPKGSIAVDGVSLTVVDVRGSAFGVALVPHTLRATTLGERAPGDRVNLEVDVLARYVARLLACGGVPGAVTPGC